MKLEKSMKGLDIKYTRDFQIFVQLDKIEKKRLIFVLWFSIIDVLKYLFRE